MTPITDADRLDLLKPIVCIRGFSGSSVGKESASCVGDLGSILGLGRSRGEGNGNLLQYSCLGSHMDRGTWWTTVHGVGYSPWGHKESDTTE